jgi:hypothetical protein
MAVVAVAGELVGDDAVVAVAIAAAVSIAVAVAVAADSVGGSVVETVGEGWFAAASAVGDGAVAAGVAVGSGESSESPLHAVTNATQARSASSRLIRTIRSVARRVSLDTAYVLGCQLVASWNTTTPDRRSG